MHHLCILKKKIKLNSCQFKLRWNVRVPYHFVVASYRRHGFSHHRGLNSDMRHNNESPYYWLFNSERPPVTVGFWARWRLKSPASRLFAHPFVQVQIKETIKVRVTGLCEKPPVTGERTGVYCEISWSFEAASFGLKLFQSLWNSADTLTVALPRCLSSFRAIRS